MMDDLDDPAGPHAVSVGKPLRPKSQARHAGRSNLPGIPLPPASGLRNFLLKHFSSRSRRAAMPEMVQRSESLISSSMRHSSQAVVDDDDTTQDRDPHVPGSIPPWVHISSAEDDQLIPPPVRPNTRHYKPPPSHYKPGRKWDHRRDAEPPLMSAPIADHQTRWVPFMQSGPHPPWHEQGAQLMSNEWMEDNVPITVRGWEEEDEALADRPEELKGFWLLSPEKRERTVRLFWVSQHTSPLLFLRQAFSICLVFMHRWKAWRVPGGGRASSRTCRHMAMLERRSWPGSGALGGQAS